MAQKIIRFASTGRLLLIQMGYLCAGKMEKEDILIICIYYRYFNNTKLVENQQTLSFKCRVGYKLVVTKPQVWNSCSMNGYCNPIGQDGLKTETELWC